MTIDGTMAGGPTGAPLIEINGLYAGTGAAGLSIEASGSTIRGLVINRFDGPAIRVTGSNCVIAGNYIGTDVPGMVAFGNGNGRVLDGADGIVVWTPATGTVIGGNQLADRNVISGNLRRGIGIYSGANIVRGNYLGTNAMGTGGLGNGSTGVAAYSSGNLIENNLISGNSGYGVTVGRGAQSNRVRANLIGTNAAGTAALGNNYGVLISASGTEDTTGNIIGGSSPGDRNVISGNTIAGVFLMARANSVTGNYIGRNQAGTSSIPNGRGVWVGSEAQAGSTGWGGNRVGGLAPGEGNWISGNTTDGVFIIESESGGTYVQGNMIDSNGGPGVNLPTSFNDPTRFATGVQISQNTFIGNGRRPIVLTDRYTQNNSERIDIAPANDGGDLDVGPNNLQNYPVITSAVPGGAATLVTGTLNSTAGTAFALEFYSSGSCDPRATVRERPILAL